MATIECVCPAKPDGSKRHAQDTVTLRPVMDFDGALAVRNVIRLMQGEPGVTTADILSAISQQYLYRCIESWTLVDAKGKPLPIDRETITEHLMSHPLEAFLVADEADDLYAAAVVLPLLVPRSTSSPDTPTDASTSPTTDSPRKHQTPSSPSSTTTTRTGVTGTTTPQPVGVSN